MPIVHRHLPLHSIRPTVSGMILDRALRTLSSGLSDDEKSFVHFGKMWQQLVGPRLTVSAGPGKAPGLAFQTFTSTSPLSMHRKPSRMRAYVEGPFSA